MMSIDLYTLSIFVLLGLLVILGVWEYIRLRVLTEYLRQQNDQDETTP